MSKNVCRKENRCGNEMQSSMQVAYRASRYLERDPSNILTLTSADGVVDFSVSRYLFFREDYHLIRKGDGWDIQRVYNRPKYYTAGGCGSPRTEYETVYEDAGHLPPEGDGGIDSPDASVDFECDAGNDAGNDAGGIDAGLDADDGGCDAGVANEAAKFYAPDFQRGDQFGQTVAISGNNFVVGSPYNDAIIGSAINDAGAAYVYHRSDGEVWSFLAKLSPSEPRTRDRFGLAVATHGNFIAVGQPGDASQLTGTVAIFKDDGRGNFANVAQVSAEDTTAGDEFATALAICGDDLIVGAWNKSAAGAAYIFGRTADDRWEETARLVASDSKQGDAFGVSVSISGDYAAVGASYEDNQNTDTGFNSGAAYVFRKGNDGVWAQSAKLVPSDVNREYMFGSSVAIDGVRIIAGAPNAFHEIGGTYGLGAAYVFERSEDGTWLENGKLVAGDAGPDDYFGNSVSVRDSHALIGAVGKGMGQMSQVGAAYLFERNSSGGWSQIQKIFPQGLEADDAFGNSVAIGESDLLIGAYQDDGPQNDAQGSGAVYVTTY